MMHLKNKGPADDFLSNESNSQTGPDAALMWRHWLHGTMIALLTHDQEHTSYQAALMKAK